MGDFELTYSFTRGREREHDEQEPSARRGVDERKEDVPAHDAAGRDGARARYESEKALSFAPEPTTALEGSGGEFIEEASGSASAASLATSRRLEQTRDRARSSSE